MATQADVTSGEGASLRMRQAMLADRAARDEAAERGIDSAVFWTGAARAATIGIFLILFFALLDQARALLLPVTAGVVIGLMLGPLSELGRRQNVPSWLSATVLTLLFLAVINTVITLLAAPLIDWVGRAPEIAGTIREKLQVLERLLAPLRDLRNAISSFGSDGALKVETGPSLIAPALAFVTPAVGQTLLFIGTLFFFLLGRDEMRKYLVSFFEDRQARLTVLRILNDMEQKLTNYLSTVTAINFAVGCATGVLAFVAGLPNPHVWGVLAFVLNYVPYIGPAITFVVLLGVGLVSFPTLAQAAIAPAVYLGLVTVEGHFITPGIISRSLTLSPLTVFLALAFWTWLWGPIGAFLAVPLLIAALSALQHIRPRGEVNLPG